jgi:hypothetical protein
VQAPIELSLSFSTPPGLGVAAVLRLSVTSAVAAPNTTVRIVLDEGLELARGDLAWHGDIPKDETVEVEAAVTAVRPGEWAINAEAVSETPGAVFGRTASLSL